MAPKPWPAGDGAELLPLFARERAALLDLIPRLPGQVIFVANEVGLGLVPETPLGRLFRDEAGRVNQAVARPVRAGGVRRRQPAAGPQGHAPPLTPTPDFPFPHFPPSPFPTTRPALLASAASPRARHRHDLRHRPPPTRESAAALQQRIDTKTKPLGALGRLETLAKQIGLVQQTLAPELRQPQMLVFAGDHGAAKAGVSAYPQDVTWQMVENFLAGGAAINVFARQMNLGLTVVDAGVAHNFRPRPGLIDAKLGQGHRQLPRNPGDGRRHPRRRPGPRPRARPARWPPTAATWSALARWASATPPPRRSSPTASPTPISPP